MIGPRNIPTLPLPWGSISWLLAIAISCVFSMRLGAQIPPPPPTAKLTISFPDGAIVTGGRSITAMVSADPANANTPLTIILGSADVPGTAEKLLLVQPPGSVEIAPRAFSATFTIETAPVYRVTNVEIMASDPSGFRATATATLTLIGEGAFLRGDCNGSGVLDISDAINTLSFIFLGTFTPQCRDGCDYDDNGELEITDAIASLSNLFLGGPPPPPPGKDNCGPDPTVDGLDCRQIPREGCVGATPEARHWDFEGGTLQGWLATGSAFENQPTWGNNMPTSRAMRHDVGFMSMLDPALQRNNDPNTNPKYAIGGDYWDGPYPIGIEGEYWIGTYENRPNRTVPWGTWKGDRPSGALVSPTFQMGKRYIHFLVGGGPPPGVAVNLQVLGPGGQWIYVVDFNPQWPLDERLRRVTVDLGPMDLANRWGRLEVIDGSEASWGHINVDDIWVTDDHPDAMDLPPPPVWGFADTHAHLAVEEGFEGLLTWNRTSDLSWDGRLRPSAETNAAAGCEAPLLCPATAHAFDVVGKSASNLIFMFEDMLTFGRKTSEFLSDVTHNPVTYENTTWYTLTHQQMYEKWLYRSYRGGQRLLVADALNNRALVWGMKKNNDVETDPESYIRQIGEIHAIAENNREWMEIALSPGHAREIINENKLAVVIGIEVDSFGGCDRKDRPVEVFNKDEFLGINLSWGNMYAYCPSTSTCDKNDLTEHLTELFEEHDVRQLHPIHLLDNGFGGAALYASQYNSANAFLNREFFSVSDGRDTEVEWTLGKPEVLITTPAAKLPIGVTTNPYDQSPIRGYTGHVNAKGLTDLGRELVKEMKRQGMLLAVDHISDRALDELLGLRGHTPPLVAADGCQDLKSPECLEKAFPIALTHTNARDLQFSWNQISMDHLRDTWGGTEAEWRDRYEDRIKSEIARRADQIERVSRIGGICAPGYAGGDLHTWPGEVDVANDCGGSSCTFAQGYNYFFEKCSTNQGVHFGMPIGTDFQGLAGGTVPRYGIFGCWKQSVHLVDNSLNNVWSMEDLGQPDSEGSLDVDQRGLQLGKYGVAYDVYGGAARVPHWTPIYQELARKLEWRYRLYMYMHPDVLSRSAADPVDRRIYPLTAARGRGNGAMGVCDAFQHYKSISTNEPDSDRFRTHWDINFDGLAHYGMLPDFLQDLRAVGFEREDMGPLFLGAEAYIRMWEKAWRFDTAQPDLMVKLRPYFVKSGSEFPFEVKVLNIGCKESGPCKGLIDGGPTMTLPFEIPALAGGRSLDMVFTLKAFDLVRPGYILLPVSVDIENLVAEKRESNNRRYARVQINP